MQPCTRRISFYRAISLIPGSSDSFAVRWLPSLSIGPPRSSCSMPCGQARRQHSTALCKRCLKLAPDQCLHEVQWPAPARRAPAVLLARPSRDNQRCPDHARALPSPPCARHRIVLCVSGLGAGVELSASMRLSRHERHPLTRQAQSPKITWAHTRCLSNWSRPVRRRWQQ